MAIPFVMQQRVEFCETDAAGIAHFTAFFRYMERAEHELLRQLGFSVVWHDEQGTISWPRVSVTCDYTGAVRFEDLLDVAVHVERLGERSITYRFEMTHQSRPVAKGKITAVCCRVAPGRPLESLAIPDWVRERLQPYVLTSASATG